MPEPDHIADLLSDIVDRVEDLTHVIRKAVETKAPEAPAQPEEPEPTDPKLLNLLGNVANALKSHTKAIATIANREQPATPAPVVNVPAPVVNIEPAQINVAAQKPQPKCGFTCRITKRDQYGAIEEFTLTPTN
ncbi:MAG: hypothetical protein EBT13_18275 [Rhodobacteraceae bacterium]|nr:hypothetical protein [Paracoccaceae bacterium]